MFISKRSLWLWTAIIFSPFMLFGCGGSSSSSPNTNYDTIPFGAESFLKTTDFDGDGEWDEKETSTFGYDTAGRLISQVVTTEWDVDADGAADSKNVYTEKYKPSIDPEYRYDTAMSGGSPTYYPNYVTTLRSNEQYKMVEGILIKSDTEIYVYDYNTKGMQTFSSYTQQIDSDLDGNLEGTDDRNDFNSSTYTYDANGNRTRRISEYSYDNPYENRIYSRDYTYTYNANGDILKKTEIYTNDNDANGSTDRIDTTIYTYTYDDDGYLLTEVEVYSADDNGDGTTDSTKTYTDTYDNKYTYDNDGNVTRVVIVESNDYSANTSTHAYDFSYDEAGNVTEEITSYDQRNANGDWVTDGSFDTFYIKAYIFDSAGRLTGRTKASEYNKDGTDGREGIDEWDSYVYTYVYDDGHLTLDTEEYKRDYNNDGNLDSWSLETNTYTYENGKLASYVFTDLDDTDQDGTLGDTDDDESVTSNTYIYESSGSLTTARTYHYKYNGFDGSEEVSAYGETFSYDGEGILTEVMMWGDDNGDDINDYSNITTLGFDELGQVSGATVTSGEYTETYQITYNGNNSVTTKKKNSDGAASETMLNFGGNGIPTGNADIMIRDMWVEYPSVSSSDKQKGEYQEYNGVYYGMTISAPKIVALIFNDEEDGKGEPQ